MTSFAEKSQQSLQAAEVLMRSNLYPSTINRAYYGFHQYMLHILFRKMGKTQEDFDNDLNAYGFGTHSLAWNLVSPAFAKNKPKDVADREWRNEFKWLQEQVASFKKIRTEADYKEITIQQEVAHDWINKAISMINLLNKGFK